MGHLSRTAAGRTVMGWTPQSAPSSNPPTTARSWATTPTGVAVVTGGWIRVGGSPGTVTGPDGADPSSVAFDGAQQRKARGVDLLVVDTAGRLHTKHNLMEELSKIRRIAGREVPGAPHEVLLVLDAVTGMNGLAQAREFLKAAGVTGLVLTKMDGTAKGGVILAIVRELKLPVRYVGVGETADDLLDFDPAGFAAALIDD